MDGYTANMLMKFWTLGDSCNNIFQHAYPKHLLRLFLALKVLLIPEAIFKSAWKYPLNKLVNSILRFFSFWGYF